MKHWQKIQSNSSAHQSNRMTGKNFVKIPVLESNVLSNSSTENAEKAMLTD